MSRKAQARLTYWCKIGDETKLSQKLSPGQTE